MQTVTFNYSTNTQDYTIVANVTPGAKSVRNQFDRFQEPDDDDHVEIVSIEDEDGEMQNEFVFTIKQQKEIEALAIERAGEEAEEIED